MTQSEENEDDGSRDDDPIESGPFCRHYHDPEDCDIICMNCGHECCQHEYDGIDCREDDCKCEGWKDPDDE